MVKAASIAEGIFPFSECDCWRHKAILDEALRQKTAKSCKLNLQCLAMFN